jgi:hypothetical protein
VEARAPARRACEGAAARDCIVGSLVVGEGGRGPEETGGEERRRERWKRIELRE